MDLPCSSSQLDKSGARIRPMFAAIADRYDRMNHLLSVNVDRYWRWWTARKVAPQGDSPVLDVCTGTGDLALAYWKRAAGSVPIVATDFCPEMLAIGRRKQRELGRLRNLEFREAKPTPRTSPFPTTSFRSSPWPSACATLRIRMRRFRK
jgi:demethylmenaquinone methyltransferase/2-methoxy-6-polyprenyl-1,4-benzoquinol methylase